MSVDVGAPASGTTAPGVAAVVFDYGGVMTTPVSESIAAWLEADGIEPASFSRTLKAWLSRDAAHGSPIHLLETGELLAHDVEQLLVAELVSRDSRPLQAEGMLNRLFAGMQPDPAMTALVEDLRGLGVRVGLLSNSWGNTYPREELEVLFDDVVISGEVGLRKPQRQIFELSLTRLGAHPAATAFVDDARPNVDGAALLGLRGILHSNPAATRAALAQIIPALHAAPALRSTP